MRTMPVEDSKFIWDIVFYISKLQAFFDFAIGCGIPSCIVQKAIEDNDPSDDDIYLDNCVAQALTVWWPKSNKPVFWKSDRIRQGFSKLNMPGIHTCLIKRHPTIDPKPPIPNNLISPQPGTSEQLSNRPAKYLSMEYITLWLKNTEYDFLRELSKLIQTPQNAYDIACITNLPDATFVSIRQEHAQGRIAFHVLVIWYILAKGVQDKASLIKEMFYDLELEEECASDKDEIGSKNKTNKIQMGTKVLGKGCKSKSTTTVNQGNCSSINPLNPIRVNGEIVDMEEQMPELVDDTENDESSANGGQQSQPLITFGQAHLNNMGTTTENLGQNINVTFAVDNEILEIPLQTHMYC